MYTYNLFETVTWLWALVLLSDKVEINHPWFQIKPETGMQYFVFTFVWGYFNAVNVINGHELLHKREWYNKLMGVMPYTKMFYSHFLDEHIKGHHRYMATPEDPATADKGESLYHFIVKSVIGSHINSWKRENERIRRSQGTKDVGASTLILNNKMTLYFIIHMTILTSIYVFLGW